MKPPTVAQAIEFAKKSRSDCTNLVTFVALQETGMLAAYMATAVALSSCSTKHTTINGHTPCATGTCWKEYPNPCQCSKSEHGACFCTQNKQLQP